MTAPGKVIRVGVAGVNRCQRDLKQWSAIHDRAISFVPFCHP